MVINDDGNYAPYKPFAGASAMGSPLTAPKSRPKSLGRINPFESTVPGPLNDWGRSGPRPPYASQTTPENRALFSTRLLCRRGAGDRYRRAGAHDLWRPGLCPPRDRPQPLCGGQPEDQGRHFRRGTGRNPRQYQRAGGVLGPRGAEVGPGRRPGPQFLFAGCHLSAGHQGAPRGGDPFQARPRNPPDRPFPSSGGGRHARAIAARRGDADRDRGRCRDLHAEGSQQSRLCDPDHAVDRRHRRNRRDPEGTVSRTFPVRTRKTSATPPPTASSR